MTSVFSDIAHDRPERPHVARNGRPTLLGTRYAAATSHPHATRAAVAALEAGGNAIDAGVAAGLAMNVVVPHYCDLGGVAPLMAFVPGMSRPVSIDGLGTAPRAATLEHYLARYAGDIPPGAPRAVVPAAVDAWLTALARFGRLRLRDVAAPAIELADGFPVYAELALAIEERAPRLSRWPTSAATFLPHGRAPAVGEILRRPELAALLRGLVQVEEASAHLGRTAAIRAARDDFYTGEPARLMAAFVRAEGGLLDEVDIAAYSVSDEEPLRTTYRGHDVYASGAWSQGPVIPLTLNILATRDLGALGHNSAPYVHFFAEALKLAFADREAFVGDPRHVDVPIAGLIGRAYGERQAARIDLRRAAAGMPEPGDPWSIEGRAATRGRPATPIVRPGPRPADTTYIAVMDSEGTAFSATPSDNSMGAPLVPGLGIVVSPRGSQFWLDPVHPSVIAPRKRPRLTPNPAMLLRDGAVDMAFGSPGGDAQPQAMLQFLANVLDHGMDVQQAVEAARLRTWSFPNSFWPHTFEPDVLTLEAGIAPDTAAALSALGHRIESWGKWVAEAAGVCAVRRIGPSVLAAAADPRRESYAMAR